MFYLEELSGSGLAHNWIKNVTGTLLGFSFLIFTLVLF